MSNTKLFNGFKDRYSYKIYRCEVQTLDLLICRIRKEEERGQIKYWLIWDYNTIVRVARKMLGYVEFLWDFDIIDEDAFEGLADAYCMIEREAKERINELSEEE